MKCDNEKCFYFSKLMEANCSCGEDSEYAERCIRGGHLFFKSADLPEAGASAERISSVVRRLPEYNEIDQVANDEASGIDWNRLEYSGIYTDGFIAGALWMKSKVNQ